MTMDSKEITFEKVLYIINGYGKNYKKGIDFFLSACNEVDKEKSPEGWKEAQKIIKILNEVLEYKEREEEFYRNERAFLQRVIHECKEEISLLNKEKELKEGIEQ